MERRISFRSTWVFAAVTVFLVLVTAFCIAGTARSVSDRNQEAKESYYRVWEQKLIQSTRKELEELGYQNCGVMLTRVTDAEGGREYTFTIHHGKISSLSAEEQQKLSARLSDCTYRVLGEDEGGDLWEQVSFCHEFLTFG